MLKDLNHYVINVGWGGRKWAWTDFRFAYKNCYQNKYYAVLSVLKTFILIISLWSTPGSQWDSHQRITWKACRRAWCCCFGTLGSGKTFAAGILHSTGGAIFRSLFTLRYFITFFAQKSWDIRDIIYISSNLWSATQIFSCLQAVFHREDVSGSP